MTARINSKRGATLIEVIIFLPLFLMGLFFVIWLGVITNARSALVSAVENGVRLGATRGLPDLYNRPDGAGRVGAIPELHTWSTGGSTLPSRAALLESPDSDPYTSLSNIDTEVATLFDTGPMRPSWQASKTDLKSLPVEYAYAMTYIVQSLRMGVSEAIRYPCDPYADQGDNCLICRPVNPATLKAGHNYDKDRAVVDANDSTILERRVAIRCDFRPSGFLLRPMLAMMSILTGKDESGAGAIGIVSHAGYFGRDSNCTINSGDSTVSPPVPPRYCCNGRCN